MSRADTLFSQEDRQRINKAIGQAESKTSAEIVPVVAENSGRYDRPEDIVGLWFALVALIAVWQLYPPPTGEAGRWGEPAAGWQLLAFAVAVVVGFIVGAWIGSRVDWLRRLFTPHKQMREEVIGRARTVFFDQRVHHTAGASGVLLYVSLFEHMTTVVCDQSVLDALGQERIDAICAEFTSLLRSGSITDAFCATAVHVGGLLESHLPRGAVDVDELDNALIVID
jgi:putative membrane protein